MCRARSTSSTSVDSVASHCWGYSGTSPGVDPVARAITSDYGLNGWEITYGIIPWLQMCKQRGLIDRVDDRPITFTIPSFPGLFVVFGRSRQPSFIRLGITTIFAA